MLKFKVMKTTVSVKVNIHIEEEIHINNINW